MENQTNLQLAVQLTIALMEDRSDRYQKTCYALKVDNGSVLDLTKAILGQLNEMSAPSANN